MDPLGTPPAVGALRLHILPDVEPGVVPYTDDTDADAAASFPRRHGLDVVDPDSCTSPPLVTARLLPGTPLPPYATALPATLGSLRLFPPADSDATTDLDLEAGDDSYTHDKQQPPHVSLNSPPLTGRRSSAYFRRHLHAPSSLDFGLVAILRAHAGRLAILLGIGLAYVVLAAWQSTANALPGARPTFHRLVWAGRTSGGGAWSYSPHGWTGGGVASDGVSQPKWNWRAFQLGSPQAGAATESLPTTSLNLQLASPRHLALVDFHAHNEETLATVLEPLTRLSSLGVQVTAYRKPARWTFRDVLTGLQRGPTYAPERFASDILTGQRAITDVALLTCDDDLERLDDALRTWWNQSLPDRKPRILCFRHRADPNDTAAAEWYLERNAIAFFSLSDAVRRQLANGRDPRSPSLPLAVSRPDVPFLTHIPLVLTDAGRGSRPADRALREERGMIESALVHGRTEDKDIQELLRELAREVNRDPWVWGYQRVSDRKKRPMFLPILPGSTPDLPFKLHLMLSPDDSYTVPPELSDVVVKHDGDVSWSRAVTEIAGVDVVLPARKVGADDAHRLTTQMSMAASARTPVVMDPSMMEDFNFGCSPYILERPPYQSEIQYILSSRNGSNPYFHSQHSESVMSSCHSRWLARNMRNLVQALELEPNLDPKPITEPTEGEKRRRRKKVLPAAPAAATPITPLAVIKPPPVELPFKLEIKLPEYTPPPPRTQLDALDDPDRRQTWNKAAAIEAQKKAQALAAIKAVEDAKKAKEEERKRKEKQRLTNKLKGIATGDEPEEEEKEQTTDEAGQQVEKRDEVPATEEGRLAAADDPHAVSDRVEEAPASEPADAATVAVPPATGGERDSALEPTSDAPGEPAANDQPTESSSDIVATEASPDDPVLSSEPVATSTESSSADDADTQEPMGESREALSEQDDVDGIAEADLGPSQEGDAVNDDQPSSNAVQRRTKRHALPDADPLSYQIDASPTEHRTVQHLEPETSFSDPLYVDDADDEEDVLVAEDAEVTDDFDLDEFAVLERDDELLPMEEQDDGAFQDAGEEQELL